MYTSYIVKNESGFVSYYTQNNILYKRSFINNKWSKAVVIQSGVKPYFSLNTAQNDSKVVIFIHSIKNEIHFIYFDEKGEFKSRPILESTNLSSNPYFFCMIEENIFTIIYAYQMEKNNYTIAKMQLINGSWSDSTVIDRAYSSNNTPFIVQKVAENHYLLFYDVHQNSLNLCYREISTNVVSDRVVYHSTLYNLIDKTLLITNTSIYTAFILKSMFSCQLLFRQKTENGYKNVKVVAEGTKIKNITMFIHDECVYITYTVGNDIYYIYGNDCDDVQFSKPQKLSKNLSINEYIKKACVINPERKYNQLIVNEKMPFQPIIITEINPFFQKVTFKNIEKIEEPVENQRLNDSSVKKHINYNKRTTMKDSTKENGTSNANLLKQISTLKTELYMKNQEIDKLQNYINSMRTAEYYNINKSNHIQESKKDNVEEKLIILEE